MWTPLNLRRVIVRCGCWFICHVNFMYLVSVNTAVGNVTPYFQYAVVVLICMF